MSAADRRASRPSELARDPFIGAARSAWNDWRQPELTPHDGLVRADHPALVRAVGRVHSATSLQLMLRNPFGFMAQYALKWKEPIREETPIDLDALQVGSLLHRILERTVADLEHRGGFSKASTADIERTVATATAAVAEAWTSELPVPPPVLWAAQLRNVRELATSALTHAFPAFDGQHSFVEVAFGRPSDYGDAEAADDAPSPWPQGTPVTVAGTDVEVSGLIDRLDLDGAGTRARVIDYKSGKVRFGGDLAQGAELQRVLYANAVRQLLGPDVAIEAYLLHPRADQALALDDPDAALAQLTRALQIAFDSLRGGSAVPGLDAFSTYAPFHLALPADAEAYEKRKADALASVLDPLEQVLAAPEGAAA